MYIKNGEGERMDPFEAPTDIGRHCEILSFKEIQIDLFVKKYSI